MQKCRSKRKYTSRLRSMSARLRRHLSLGRGVREVILGKRTNDQNRTEQPAGKQGNQGRKQLHDISQFAYWDQGDREIG